MKDWPAALAASAFLTGCSTAHSQPGELPDALAAGWNGEPVCELLHDKPTHRVLRCTFPPGVGHERHYHPPHFGYALSGGKARLTDATGTREATMATGSHFESQGTPWHEMLNIGDTDIIYLMIEEK